MIGSGEPLALENILEFHLLYSGPLHVNGDRGEKHAIRKVLHAQLYRLWLTDTNLRALSEHRGRMAYAHEVGGNVDVPELSDDDAIKKGMLSGAKNWNRCGFNFLPLVTKEFCLRCALEILFLRAEERNYVLQGGDIDGRIKTLFDGLRMIQEGNELPPREKAESEEPFCCLLENDDLISEVRVNTGMLLGLPNKPFDKSDVYLQITVRLNPTRIGFDTWIV